VNRFLGLSSFLTSSVVLAVAAQPGLAANATITGIQVNRSDSGLEIVLKTQDGEAANVFTVNQGNTLRADITRTQLSLPDGNQFQQMNPAPGIASVTLSPLDANSVRLTVEGINEAPVGEVTAADSNGFVLAVNTDGTAQAVSDPVPTDLQTVPGEDPAPAIAQAEPTQPDATPAAEDMPQPTPQSQNQPDVLVPDPSVTIDGVPAAAPRRQEAPPFLPRAVAPPIGDIAVAEGSPTFGAIDLGSNERIPKLVLRNAPAREVLALLARAAGLNLVFTADTADGQAAADDEGPTVTLDIENESVQDVFNHVLRVSGLDANRVGRSIYVGPRLPISAQNVTVRTLRLNQVQAAVAANFLVALGAESAISREQLVTNVNAVEVGEGVAPVTQTATTTVEAIENQRVDYEDSQPILRGLVVVADERTNSVTLVGKPQLIGIATEQLTRIDLRRRQVAINVRVIDVDLNAIDAFSTSFGFSIGSVRVGTNTTPSGGLTVGSPINPSGFLFALQASVQEGNAKILTDPTLIVGEGQTASVALTEDVVTEISTDVQITNNQTVTTTNFTTEPAGLVLQIDVDRIDDNGFVALSVAPSISAPSGQTFDTGEGAITLLSRRSLNSGQVRVRDGQTLLLSGIIQESERSTVSKVPILGDIPLLGALFRSTSEENQRQELIVLLTPEILDDSDQTTFGYTYTPSEEVQDLLEQYR
jgi:type IV pilus assembly protein PilQ